MRKRPYGISYDGAPSNRFLGCRFKKQHQREQLELPHDKKVSHHICKIQPTIQSVKPIGLDDTIKLATQPQDLALYQDYSYIQKFLNLGNKDEDKFQHESSEQDERCDFLSQANIDLLCKRRPIKLILVDEKNVLVCKCGKKYTKNKQFQVHLKKYPSHWLQTESKSLQNPLKPSKINKNWSIRILEAIFTLNFRNEAQLNNLMEKLKGVTIQLNLNVPSQKALFEFYEADDYERVKLSVLWFGLALKQFCETHQDLKDLWMLQFNKFGLVANVYHGWVTTGRNGSVEVEHNVDNFLLDMFLIFNQWCYDRKYTTTLIRKYGKGLLQV